MHGTFSLISLLRCKLYHALIIELSNRPQVSMVYLVNKPPPAAGLSADNVRG